MTPNHLLCQADDVIFSFKVFMSGFFFYIKNRLDFTFWLPGHIILKFSFSFLDVSNVVSQLKDFCAYYYQFPTKKFVILRPIRLRILFDSMEFPSPLFLRTHTLHLETRDSRISPLFCDNVCGF